MHMVAARIGCKWPWLGSGGPSLTLGAWTGLENTTLISQAVHFWQGRLLGCITTKSADYCMLI